MAETIVRYTTKPTKFDVHPYGTLCAVMLNDEGTEQQFYIQTSKDEADPVWLSADELALYAFGRYLKEPWFIEKLLELYDRKETIDKLLNLN